METPLAPGVAPDRTIRHVVVRIENLLPEPELAALFDGVLAREPDFVPSVTDDHRDDVRRSLVLDPPQELVRAVVSRVREVMPQVMGAIRLPGIVVGEIEAQVTANNDGAYFAVHTDADYARATRRYLTYVYYFNRQPRPFVGGELRVYDDVLRNNKLARASTFQVVEPLHNSLVFFWARAMHEVMLVGVPSKSFRDSRFTVNGWVNQAVARSPG
jgi:Rps23 Pro-64 3,4-dihydroxylase Tpa1-like proline 4-hydroxylase